MIESQIAYVLDALRTRRGATVEVRPEVEARFHAEVQRRMQGTVWNTGCKSWYQDEQGHNPTLWPDWTWRYRQRTAQLQRRGVRDRMKRIIITGAAGGIGSATVALLRARGAQVVGLDLAGADLECDVRDQASVDRAVAAAIDQLGGLDVLINNAGLGTPQSAAPRPTRPRSPCSTSTSSARGA